MKNIKVNLINAKGTKSSTTLNFAICEAYYKVACGLSGMPRDIDISTYCHESIDDYLKGVRYCVQSYVNDLCADAAASGYLGVSQRFIEVNMLDHVIHNQGY